MRAAVTMGAIVVTDMVGSTDLRTRLGEDRSDRLRRDHDELLAAAVATHGGSILRWTGDGMKAAFASASDAVAAALAVQREVAAYGGRPDAITPFRVRIGVAVGEVTIEDGDHHGLPAIEAARLEALARPGETLVTDLVRSLGGHRVDATFEALGERVLKGLPRPVLVHRVVAVDAIRSVPLPRLVTSDRRLPLVGRARELLRLETRWATAQLGAGGACIVRGPSGRGKSRLVSHLAERAHADGAIVLAGACDSELGVPYQVLADALAPIAGATGNGGASSPALRRLFPGTATEPTEAPPDFARTELFDAVAEVFADLANRQPVLVVLEDLHWATPSTVRLLHHVVSGITDRRVLLLATTRPDDRGTTSARFELSALARDLGPADVVELSELDERDVAELVVALRPTTDPVRVAQLARTIHGESGGSPFFAAELLHHLHSTGQLDHVGADVGARLSIPETVHDAIGQRVGRLLPGTDEALRLASLIGAEFDLDLLAAALGRDPDSVLDLLDDACRDGLLVETGIDRFAFVHTIARTALSEQWSPTRMARAHRRIAESLEAARPEQFDELTRHWRLAGAGDRAIVYLAQAARRDLVALDFESARRRYEELLGLIELDPSVDVRMRARALLGHGAAGRALGDPTYTSSITRAGRLAAGIRDAELIAEAAVLSLWPGTFFFVANSPDHSLIEMCESALGLVTDDEPMRVRVLATLAAHLTFTEQHDRRRELLAEARQLAAVHGEPSLLVDALTAEFLCLWDPSTLERREWIADELGRLNREIGSADTEFLAGFFAAYCRAERGDLTRARQDVDGLLPVARLTRNRYFSFLTERLLLAIDILRGEADLQPRVDALHHEFADTHADTTGTWALQTGALAYYQGTFASMLNSLEAMTAGPLASTWTVGIALAHLAAGNRAAAAELLARTDVLPLNYFWITVMQIRAEVAAGLGDVERSRTAYDALLPYRGRLGITASGTLCFGLVSTSLATSAFALGHIDDARAHLAEAIEQAEAMGARSELQRLRTLASGR